MARSDTSIADAAGTADSDVPGIDTHKVGAWLSDHVNGSAPPFAYHLVAGGRSNLTFKVDDAAGHTYCLRRPPVSHVLPTAHDMVREHRVISALGPTSVPVPAAYGICQDAEVNGAPFYVMEFVNGAVLRDRTAAETAFDEPIRRRIGPNMADTLAALHAVDVDAVGLGDLGRRTGYIERQLRRWTEQYSMMAVPGVDHGGLVEQVGEALSASVPYQRATTIVHGDYRLDNVVLNSHGAVSAILDWEICTLGDPMADVGLLMVYWASADDGEPLLGVMSPTAAAGFSSRPELLDHYAAASRRDVSDVAYFMAFGYWKLACILQGVYARYVGGAKAGDPGSVDEFPRTIARLARLAADTLESQ